MVRELEGKCLGLDSAISGKEHTLRTLEKHCDDANRSVSIISSGSSSSGSTV